MRAYTFNEDGSIDKDGVRQDATIDDLHPIVSMGAGDDRFEALGGSVVGIIDGGTGTDTFVRAAIFGNTSFNNEFSNTLYVRFVSSRREYKLWQHNRQDDSTTQEEEEQGESTSSSARTASVMREYINVGEGAIRYQAVRRSSCDGLSGNNQRICVALFDSLPDKAEEDLSLEEWEWKERVMSVSTDYIALGQGDRRFIVKRRYDNGCGFDVDV